MINLKILLQKREGKEIVKVERKEVAANKKCLKK